MAKDLGEVVRDAVGQVAREAAQSIGDGGRSKDASGGRLSGMKGVAAGAGLAALAPLAAKGAKPVGRLLSNGLGGVKDAAGSAGSKAGEGVGGKLKETVSEKVDEAGGVGGLAKEAGKSLLPGAGDGGGGKGGVPGVGKGRRMPVQQAVDVAVPIETAYNQWTQFEEWPNFMFRLTRVTQEDDCTVSFATKMWGFTREFTAEIETERPEERIKWSVKQGPAHTGVVTFHEIGERLTRIELNLDVDPGSLIEKAARGMRHVKRAVRSDLHRYKAFIEMQELESGAWRGVIEDGELVEPHPEEYDEERDYGEIEHSLHEDDEDESEDGGDEEQPEASEKAAEGQDGSEEEGAEEEDSESQRSRSRRFQRQASRSSGRSRSRGNRGRSEDSPERPSRPRKPAGRR
jgi:uncharacterized membrane protein